jgi:phage shock protein PspC (stress-responsive transcriptional regulator)
MRLERQLKIALDESRLLILGSQVLFGFQFNGVFQQQFDTLPVVSRVFVSAGLFLIVVALALLITPSMHHRIVERGQDSQRVLSLATMCAGSAVLPIAVALALDMFVAMQRITSGSVAAGAAGTFFGLAMLCWYAVAWITMRKEKSVQEPNTPTTLETQVDQLLTEARVIIPGVQALLGFQLTVTLTQAFAELATGAKIVHACALCCTGLAVILLMAPASVHRIAFSGQDDPAFVRIGSVFVVAAPLPLALGIALDAYVAAGRALQSEPAVLGLAAVALLLLLGFWYAFPLWRRVTT